MNDANERETRALCREILATKLRWKKPQLINADAALKEVEDFGEQDPVYVLPVYLSPGKQGVMIEEPPAGAQPTADHGPRRLLTFLVEPRKEQIKSFVKPLRGRKFVRRQFVKSESVFADWREDTPKVVKDCIEHDTKYWKLFKFIKDPVEMAEVVAVVREHLPMLKEIYANLQAESHLYPGVSVATITAFCLDMKLKDKHFHKEDANRLFINSHFKDAAYRDSVMDDRTRKKQTQQWERLSQSDGDDVNFLMVHALPRYEVFEFLIRVVK